MSTAISYPGLVEPGIGALLRRSSEASHRVLYDRLGAAGFDDLRDSHYALFVFPGPHGARPTELAQRVGLSKQALNTLLNDLEAFGYLTRQPGSPDRREKILVLTERGLRFAAAAKAIVEGIERDLAGKLGQRRFAEFRAILAQIPAILVDIPSGPEQSTRQKPPGMSSGSSASRP